jgi:hypothetical protein
MTIRLRVPSKAKLLQHCGTHRTTLLVLTNLSYVRKTFLTKVWSTYHHQPDTHCHCRLRGGPARCTESSINDTSAQIRSWELKAQAQALKPDQMCSLQARIQGHADRVFFASLSALITPRPESYVSSIKRTCSRSNIVEPGCSFTSHNRKYEKEARIVCDSES